ncbi:MAG: cysteine--tRNA ligase, partial [Phycisphaeraceae bacterium]
MPEIRFYNTLTHREERFEPIEPGKVSMYNCGPTVYDFAHIGNFRAFVFADVLRRFLELAGYDVAQVMNITDVGHMTEDQLADGGGEDKMALAMDKLKAAKKQGVAEVDNPSDPYQVAAYFTGAFLHDAKALGLKIALEHDEHPERMPRATEHVEKSMIPMIQRLLDRGHAYQAEDGAVYYSVESYPAYGRLSGNTLDQLKGGAGGRVLGEHQKGKHHPADFLLWKPDPSHIMKWPSPFGEQEGYPGWHIECSAMATAVLGRETIDIHTGGEDNIFPHHECEIAQTCGATGHERFANYWLHTRFLLVEGQKMSKSKGNFFTVRDLLTGNVPGRDGRGVDPAVIRFELMRAHYRSNMNFTLKGLEDAASAVARLRDAAAAWSEACRDQPRDVGVDHPVVGHFLDNLADDLNVAGALGVVFEYLKSEPSDPAEALGVIRKLDTVVQVLERRDSDARGTPDDEAQAKARQLDEARAAKDFDRADALR